MHGMTTTAYDRGGDHAQKIAAYDGIAAACRQAALCAMDARDVEAAAFVVGMCDTLLTLVQERAANANG